MERWGAYILALLLSALLGCSDPGVPGEVLPDLTIEQKYLFDTYSINFAWGYHLAGTYIDNEGYVVRYNHSFEQWVADDFYNLTQAELDEKYVAPYDTVAVIDPAILYEMYEKIVPASQGELSERVHTGSDAGSATRVCYRYDETSERYARVLLTLAGDYTQTNLSAAAEELDDWLSLVLYPEAD